ncbi:hypothetical protein Aab01nite_13590 [Paractinoplanes abujensis]|uniref:DUF4097 and DUF4098 domain-containing protein YvlB n=1 Tax=Paractinoplanes abujensis TaxID=882441 RepID=A0A7W7FYA9_9ACTN|nr:DUF4097 family beta strand repeat-containing protein [Actinoplanes abujensis]MBB4690818.1 DUF4097 and DUF4098 domain-containing protein YvlB [Actinoplanes abujensis]GID17769.1 hypothetical protein Aab01nite_13590 [Actinoplanes abujensis]
MFEFEHPAPVTVTLRANSGVVTLHAEQRDTVQVTVDAMDDRDSSREAADKTRVVLDGDTLVIEVPNDNRIWRRSAKLAITARVPTGSGLHGKSASADIQAAGIWSDVKLDVASADVELAEATGNVSLDSASGDLGVGRAGGLVKLDTASGDVRLHDVTGDAKVKSASGDVRVGSIGGALRASTASGDVVVGRLTTGQNEIKTASGDVQVGIAAGAGIWLDLDTASGRTTSDLTPQGDAPSGATIELRIRTASGDIHIHRATTEGKTL